jgi:hypothetical protein
MEENNFQALPISQYHIKNCLSFIGYRFSAVFIINNLIGGTIQEPRIQKVYLGFLSTDPTVKNPTLALVCSETHFLFACSSIIFIFINAMKIPSIS